MTLLAALLAALRAAQTGSPGGVASRRVDPDKLATLKAEAARLAQAARASDTLLDLSARRSPGPVNDVDVDELAVELARVRLDDRSSWVVADRSGRVLQMARRGR